MKTTRQTDTKQRMKDSFIELINEEGFDQLTVSSLARHSEINRGTFYLHYLDKYDMMEQLEQEVIDDLKGILLAEDTNQPAEGEEQFELIPYELLLEALYYIKDDFEFVQAIAGEGGDPHFISKLKGILSDLIHAKLATLPDVRFANKYIPEDYALEVFLSGTVAIIRLWISKSGEETPKEVAAMIWEAMQRAPVELLTAGVDTTRIK